jgi:hypothetical protein
MRRQILSSASSGRPLAPRSTLAVHLLFASLNSTFLDPAKIPAAGSQFSKIAVDMCCTEPGKYSERRNYTPAALCAISARGLAWSPEGGFLYTIYGSWIKCGGSLKTLKTDDDTLSLPRSACAEYARRGQCGEYDIDHDDIDDLCAAECAVLVQSTSNATANPADPSTVQAAGSPSSGAGFQILVSCRTLIELEGGCAHDLSVRELTYPAGTRVSDVCPTECSGHVNCAPAALDVSFLGVVEDSSGHGGSVELHGGACVDEGSSGLVLSGDNPSCKNIETGPAWDALVMQIGAAGFPWPVTTCAQIQPYCFPEPGSAIADMSSIVRESCPQACQTCLASVEATIGMDYYSDIGFSVAFWVLKHPADVWASPTATLEPETVYFHQPRMRTVDASVHVRLSREEWLDAWTLGVQVNGGLGTINHDVYVAAQVDLIRDSTPMWTHILITSHSHDGISIFENGQWLRSKPQYMGNGWRPFARMATSPVPALPTLADWLRYNAVASRSTEDFSVLNELESWRQSDGKLHMKLVYPLRSKGANSNEWRQTSNPVTSTSLNVDGYEPIDIQMSQNHWGGLRHGNPNPTNCVESGQQPGINCGAFLEGSIGPDANPNWCYTIGAAVKFPGVGFASRVVVGPECNPFSPTDYRVELWAYRPPDELDAVIQPTTGIRIAGGILSDKVYVGGMNGGAGALRGSLAMLQVYGAVLSADQVRCTYESGKQLVQSGRMAQSSPTQCRDAAMVTGCTSHVATGRRLALSNEPLAWRSNVDDGSCVFDVVRGTGERGVLHITDSWQRVALHGSYTTPLVFIGVLTRQSTAQTVARLRNVAMAAGGAWSFEVQAEQKSCHFAKPPPTAERVSYLVVEAGVSAEGWQAGVIRSHDREWHRVSLLQRLDVHGPAPVVISHVQNYDSRTEFVTTRHNLVPLPSKMGGSIEPHPIEPHPRPYQAFFVQVHGEGTWCPDMHYYTEYFDNLDLGGTPAATQCEPTAPDWHWHHNNGAGVPPAIAGRGDPAKPFLFSARWTTRIHVRAEDTASFRFSSRASGGSRIMLDGATVVDNWEEWGPIFTSDPVPTGVGYHYIVYEYRSADRRDEYATPTDSYATLTWTSGAEAVPGSVNSSGVVASGAEPVHADVGWLSFASGNGTVRGAAGHPEAGFATVMHSSTSVNFGARFDTAPLVFGAIISVGRVNAHLRLLEASEQHMSIATEYDTCNFIIDVGDYLAGWIAFPYATNMDVLEPATVSRRSTRFSDVVALLSIAESLGLPDYVQWRNGSDPCSDRWAGVECLARAGEDLRVVVLDVSPIL